MNGEPMKQHRPVRGRRIVVFVPLGGCAVLALLIGGVLLKVRADDSHARAEIQKRLDAIRAAGEPLTAQDLAELYPDPPPERDARRMLSPGLSALVVPEDDELPLFYGGDLPARS